MVADADPDVQASVNVTGKVPRVLFSEVMEKLVFPAADIVLVVGETDILLVEVVVIFPALVTVI